MCQGSIRGDKNVNESKNKLISMLEDLLAKTPPSIKKQLLSEKYGIKMSYTLERTISTMCNLSEFFIDQAISEGLEKGMAQGMAQGIEAGILALISTLRELNQTNEYILSKIIEKFDLTEEDAVKYL